MNQAEPVKAQRSFWQRVGSIYQTVALLVFNTLLLLVIAVVVINITVPDGNDAAPANNNEVKPFGFNTLYSTYFDRSAYYFSSQQEVTAMLEDYDAMARAGHWMVNPWTGLTMRPFKSKYLNIDRNGFRVGAPVDNNYKWKPPLVVWAFGGSTLFGWGVEDKFSIPALLQIQLQKRLPEREVQVLNFAVPIYNSSQEVALFAANLRQSKPDIAFFFDGVNDVWYTVHQYTQTPLVDPLAGVWEKNTYALTHPQQAEWLTINASFPLLRLAQKLGLPIGQGVLTDDLIQYAMRGFDASTRDELLAVAVRNYSANRQMEDAIGSGLGVKTFFFLQPYLSNKVDMTKFRNQLAQQPTMKNYYDISDMLNGELPDKRKGLLDDFHYSDYGAALVAARLADILAQDLK